MGTRARIAVGVALTSLLVATGCAGGLRDDVADGDGDGDSSETVSAWPEPEIAGSTSSPANPEVGIDVREVVRSADGLTTLLFDVVNDGNDEVQLHDLMGQDSGALFVSLFDPDQRVRHHPVQRTDGFGACLCSSDVTIDPGETVTAYSTFDDVDGGTGEVRVEIDDYSPVAGVPVRGVGEFRTEASTDAIVEYDPDLEVRVTSVTRAGSDGTVLRVRYTNARSAEPVDLSRFPEPGSLSIVDADDLAYFEARQSSSFEPVVQGDSDIDELAEGDSVTYDVLVAPLPSATDRVFLRGPGLRRSFPVVVAAENGDNDLRVPSDLEEPVISELIGPEERFQTTMVDTAEADEPPVDELGPELPDLDVVGAPLTSDAQPGWTVGVRGVVRSPSSYSTLIMDLGCNGCENLWPESLGIDGDDLAGLEIIDPASQALYGTVLNNDFAFSSDDDIFFDDGETRRVYATFEDVGDATAVTVDVPAFGAVEGVPVVDAPGPADGDVAATLRLERNPGLRLDVLEIGTMPDEAGTLVRTRMVNESSTDSIEAPFGDTDGTCDLILVDPATGGRAFGLDPCHNTTWSADLAAGESLVFETRFPPLVDVEEVLVDAPGFLPTATPVPMATDLLPWYLSLPRPADEPAGDQVAGSVGTSDGTSETTRSGDTVQVVLNADVLFAFDSATLTPEAAATVDAVAADLAETAEGGEVAIVGHTDSVGDDATNQALSEQRAQSVQTALQGAVDRPDLSYEVEGRGASEPVAPNEVNGNDNPDGRAENRRVEITYTVG